MPVARANRTGGGDGSDGSQATLARRAVATPPATPPAMPPATRTAGASSDAGVDRAKGGSGNTGAVRVRRGDSKGGSGPTAASRARLAEAEQRRHQRYNLAFLLSSGGGSSSGGAGARWAPGDARAPTPSGDGDAGDDGRMGAYRFIGMGDGGCAGGPSTWTTRAQLSSGSNGDTATSSSHTQGNGDTRGGAGSDGGGGGGGVEAAAHTEAHHRPTVVRGDDSSGGGAGAAHLRHGAINVAAMHSTTCNTDATVPSSFSSPPSPPSLSSDWLPVVRPRLCPLSPLSSPAASTTVAADWLRDAELAPAVQWEVDTPVRAPARPRGTHTAGRVDEGDTRTATVGVERGAEAGVLAAKVGGYAMGEQSEAWVEPTGLAARLARARDVLVLQGGGAGSHSLGRGHPHRGLPLTSEASDKFPLDNGSQLIASQPISGGCGGSDDSIGEHWDRLQRNNQPARGLGLHGTDAAFAAMFAPRGDYQLQAHVDLKLEDTAKFYW